VAGKNIAARTASVALPWNCAQVAHFDRLVRGIRTGAHLGRVGHETQRLGGRIVRIQRRKRGRACRSDHQPKCRANAPAMRPLLQSLDESASYASLRILTVKKIILPLFAAPLL